MNASPKPMVAKRELQGAGPRVNALLIAGIVGASVVTQEISLQISYRAGFYWWNAFFLSIPVAAGLIFWALKFNRESSRFFEVSEKGLYLNQNFNAWKIPFEDIGRIHFIRGSYSAIFGKNGDRLVRIDPDLADEKIMAVVERYGEIHGFEVNIEGI